MLVWLSARQWASVDPAQHPLQQINLYHLCTRLPLQLERLFTRLSANEKSLVSTGQLGLAQ